MELDAFRKTYDDKDKVFRCNSCENRYVTESSLKYHKSKFHKSYSKSKTVPYSETTVYCKLCDLNFRSSGGFVQHKFKIHSLEMEAFTKDYTEADLMYQCQICKKKVATDLSLKSHMSRKHNKNKKKRKVKLENQERYCQLCYIVYKKACFLEKHKKKVHANEMEAFDRDLRPEDMTNRCSKCKKGFLTQNTLDHHIHRKHSSRKYSKSQIVPVSDSTVYCKLCDLNFRSSGGFVQHQLKTHSLEMDAFNKDYTEEDLIYQCRLCKKKVATDLSLKSHMSRRHYKNKKKLNVKLESRERYCKLCYIMYKKAYFLEKHKNNVHASEMEAFDRDLYPRDMTFVCAKCNKGFYTQNTLDHHIHRKHYNMKHDPQQLSQQEPSYCELCYLPFKFPSNVRKHQSNVHKNDLWALKVKITEDMKKYPCEHCDKKFLSESLLKYHGTTQHKGLKDNASYCSLCYVDFKFNSNLKAHISKIHTSKEESDALNVKLELSTLPYGCKFCKKKFLTKNIQRYHSIHNHKEEKRKDKKCEFCGQVFIFKHTREKVMANHMRLKHNVHSEDVEGPSSSKHEVNDAVKSFMQVLNSLKR